MINIIDKTECTGCAACTNICGHKAIQMTFDEKGHAYPIVNKDKCIDCGLCEQVCPLLHSEQIPEDSSICKYPLVYAAYNRDDEIRKRSTSGGIFSILANFVLQQKGIVFAVRFDKDWRVIHTSFESISELDAFRGSKYVQSEIFNTYQLVKSELKNNRWALFVGTPCQVAGLKSYLRKDYDKLLTCDFICMGISSPVIWSEYLDVYWKRNLIKNICFKDKCKSWHKWNMLIEDNHGKHTCVGMDNPFFNCYLTHLIFRPSCFHCRFRHLRHVSDFTIADCWGIDKVYPEFDDDKGCTTLMLQNEKAELTFNILKDNIQINRYSRSDVIKYNSHSVKQPTIDPLTEVFYKTYRDWGFKIAFKQIIKLRRKNALIKRIKKVMHRIVNIK